MDIVLGFCDEYVLTPYVYPEWMQEDNILRQYISLTFISGLGGALLYLIGSTLSYIFLFDKKLRQHPHFLKDQEKLEITETLKAVPGMALLTASLFLAEVRGYSQLYDDHTKFGGIKFLVLSFFTFLFFTDMCIYWIHRWLHIPFFYKRLHKLHHKWKVPSPFASHAFHPVDGFAQSFPYHLYPFLFPLHKGLYLALFVFVNFWTIAIHDANYQLPKILQPIVNGCAHHTDHHLKFTVNYGQYFTLWDRIGGSYRHPGAYSGDGPQDQVERYLKTHKAEPCVDPADAPEMVKKQN